MGLWLHRIKQVEIKEKRRQSQGDAMYLLKETDAGWHLTGRPQSCDDTKINRNRLILDVRVT